MVRVSLASQLRLAALGMACAGAASLAFAPSASAFRPNEASLQLEILPGTEQFQFMYRSADLANDADVQSYTAQLHGELGSAWKVTSWNQYSGTARSVQGPGIVLASEGLASASEDRVESLARGFIAEHAALFATDGSNLVLQKIGHGAERWGVIFQQQLDGVTVQGTQVILAMHDNGRLFAFGSDLYPDVYVPFADQVDLVAARQIARDAVPYDPTLEYEIGPDARVIVPVLHGRGDIDYHMTHRTDVPVREPLGVYRTWVDAVTGEIVYRENQVEFAYEGTTSGDVEVFSPCDGDSPDTPHPHMTVNIDGVGSVDTDDDGNFSIAGDAGTRNFNAAFDGPDFNVNCNGCGGDAVFNGTIDPDTPEA
ncbi:MAG: hypothetical protein R3E12_20480, partial [Candidatus Eisenbacteria bacterium]